MAKFPSLSHTLQRGGPTKTFQKTLTIQAARITTHPPSPTHLATRRNREARGMGELYRCRRVGVPPFCVRKAWRRTKRSREQVSTPRLPWDRTVSGLAVSHSCVPYDSAAVFAGSTRTRWRWEGRVAHVVSTWGLESITASFSCTERTVPINRSPRYCKRLSQL